MLVLKTFWGADFVFFRHAFHECWFVLKLCKHTKHLSKLTKTKFQNFLNLFTKYFYFYCSRGSIWAREQKRTFAPDTPYSLTIGIFFLPQEFVPTFTLHQLVFHMLLTISKSYMIHVQSSTTINKMDLCKVVPNLPATHEWLVTNINRELWCSTSLHLFINRELYFDVREEVTSEELLVWQWYRVQYQDVLEGS